MRKLTSYAIESGQIRNLLAKLVDDSTGIQEYKSCFYELGMALSGLIWRTQALGDGTRVTLACSSEDADWLSKGILDDLQSRSVHPSLAVFWNLRNDPFDNRQYPVAPIVKSYIESSETTEVLVICKSIISTSCVVRTNLTYLIEKINPSRIFIASPVLMGNAIESLKNEFPKAISEKFSFLYFAEDNEVNQAGEVIPGIGGSVYQRLGLESGPAKNKYVPEIVKERRTQKAKL